MNINPASAAGQTPAPRFTPWKTVVVNGISQVVLPDAPSGDAATIAGWFHDDRRKAAAQAMQAIYDSASMSRAKDAPQLMVLASLAKRALMERDFDVSELLVCLGPVH